MSLGTEGVEDFLKIKEKTALSSNKVLYTSHDLKPAVPFKHLLMLQSLSSKLAYMTTLLFKRMPAWLGSPKIQNAFW
jgi:hypothetical protein